MGIIGHLPNIQYRYEDKPPWQLIQHDWHSDKKRKLTVRQLIWYKKLTVIWFLTRSQAFDSCVPKQPVYQIWMVDEIRLVITPSKLYWWMINFHSFDPGGKTIKYKEFGNFTFLGMTNIWCKIVASEIRWVRAHKTLLLCQATSSFFKSLKLDWPDNEFKKISVNASLKHQS